MTVMSKRSGARDSSSSTARIPAIPAPTTTSRGRPKRSLLMAASHARSHARFGEARRTQCKKALAQVVPPRERDAGHIEHQEDFQRQMRTPGGCNRGAEAARDQIAAAGADCANESQRGGALDAGRLQGERPAGLI